LWCDSVLTYLEFYFLQMESLWKYQVHDLQAASTSRWQVLSHLCLFQRYCCWCSDFCSVFWFRFVEFNILVIVLQQVLILLLILQEFVLCAESKYLTPSFINKAMHNTTEILSGASGLSVITVDLWLLLSSIVKLLNM